MKIELRQALFKCSAFFVLNLCIYEEPLKTTEVRTMNKKTPALIKPLLEGAVQSLHRSLQEYLSNTQF